MSNPIRRKYATLESIERSGLLLPHERDILTALGKFEDETKHSLYVVNWAIALVRKAKDDGFFETPVDASRVLDSLLVFKKSCSSILKFKFIRFPPQFLHVAVFISFFTFLLVLIHF
jgi:hypothetical protein